MLDKANTRWLQDRPHAGAGEECEESSSKEEEGAAEKMCDELTITPIPCPPGRKEVQKSGVKLSPEGWG